MSGLQSPLTVRISNARADQHVTRRIADLEFTSTAPGGFEGASFELADPIDIDDPLLALESRVYVYDTRSAEVCWEGKLTDSGRSFSDSGETWQLTALGPKSHASARFRPYVVIDRTLDRWIRINNAWPALTAEVTSNPVDSTNDKCLLFTFPRVAVDNTAQVSLYNGLYEDNGLVLGGFGYSYISGFSSANQELLAIVNGTTYKNNAMNVAAASITPASVNGAGSFPYPDSRLWLQLNRVSGGPTTIINDNTWTCVYDLWTRGMLYDKTGATITGAGTYTNAYVLAHEVVADLLGRFLVEYDGAGATLPVTTYQIDQLAYPDGVRPADVLDDIALFSVPDRRWCAWESNAAGKYRFEWDTWGGVAYEASVVDGFDSPGSSADLYNRVTVLGTDARGRQQSVRCSASVPALGSAIHEAEPIDLGSEAYSTANAQRIGDQFLAEHAYPPNAGTLTVRRQILDLGKGRMVDPWQIRPGELIRVRGVNAHPDSLNNTSTRDGSTVFRLTGTSFRDSDRAATLALDSPASTLDTMIARLQRKRRRAKK